jgi:hypothetical protein
MGWERRGNATYFYTAQRVGGRVVKRYAGAGAVGELAAQLEALERQNREDQRDADRAERDAVAALDAPLLELDEWADLIARAALAAAGYAQHHRGEWRKRRG